MASNSVRIRVWCEDDRHERFVRQLLADVFSIDRRAVRVAKAPKGEGAASAWVRRRYYDEVLPTYRRVHHQQPRLGFLVMVDGDNAGFQSRLRDLEADRRASGDRIAILAPTWSVETWVLWLAGESVTETEQTRGRLSSDFAERLRSAIAQWTPPQKNELPSLASARIELDNRLPQ